MASSEAVAAYRETHTVAETCAYFGIKDRAVYKAVAKVKERAAASPSDSLPVATPARPALRLVAPSAARRGVPSRPDPAPLTGGLSEKILTYQAELDEVADETTVWTCPYTGLSFPNIPAPVPGTKKRVWLADRRSAFHLQKKTPPPAPVPVPAPALQPLPVASAPAPAPVRNGLESGPAPALATDFATLAPAPVHLHRAAATPTATLPAVRRSPVSSGRSSWGSSLSMQGYEWMIEKGPPWTVWVALAVFGLLVLACSV